MQYMMGWQQRLPGIDIQGTEIAAVSFTWGLSLTSKVATAVTTPACGISSVPFQLALQAQAMKPCLLSEPKPLACNDQH
jgi:hypothetical protein